MKANATAHESAVLASIVENANGQLPQALARLLKHAPESFDDLGLGKIAVVVRELLAAGKPVHALTLSEAGEPSTIEISKLLDSALPIDLAEAEAQTVWAGFQRRKVIALLGEACDTAQRHPDKAASIARTVVEGLKELTGAGDDTIEAREVGSLIAPAANDDSEFVTRRWLCRGAGLLLVGQSGQGKSSLALQLLILWALGRAAFGLCPVRPLRALIVQAENDDGDLFEMFSGIVEGLQLSADDRKLAGERIVFFTEDSRAGDDFLTRTVAPLLAKYKPDLLLLDPALAYLSGDTKDAEAVGNFLRRGLNPLLHRYGCAVVVVHHTTKQKSDGQQVTGDFLYAGAGSIEFTNWARAVLALETRGNGVYRLHAPKRGARIGWQDADGQTVFDQFIRHTRTPGAIFWQAVDADEVDSAARTGKSKLDLLAQVPKAGSLPQTVLLEKANAAGIGQKKARSFLDELIDDGTLHVWAVKRSGTNAEKRISRHPQPQGELVAV